MTDLPKPKLIIFDLDGTLVDTEILHNDIFLDMLRDKGIPATFDEVHELIAAKTLAIGYQTMRDHFGWSDFGEAEIAEYLQRFHDGIVAKGNAILIADALDTFTRCVKTVPAAVATNGEVDLSELKLRNAGFFDALPDLKWYTKDAVEHPKPAPDLFLHVAREFGVEPQDCWVIEDSPTGVRAGVAAGMDVIGFVGVAHDKPMASAQLKALGAETVIESYAEFASLLGA